MNPYDLGLGFALGVVVGLILAYIVIPGIVDVWASGLRRHRTRRHRG